MWAESILAFQGEHRFLSNFWPCRIVHDGVVYPTAEHLYQAMKTDDVGSRILISKLPTPGKAKRAGLSVFPRKDWNEVRLAVMHEVVTAKFSQNTDLGDLLIATGDAELIEGNSWGDRFWGKVDGQDRHLEGLIGQNWLGHILMITRSRLILVS